MAKNAKSRGKQTVSKVENPGTDLGGFQIGLINFILILLSVMGILYVMDPSLGLVKTVGMWIVAAFVALMGQLLAGNVLKLGGRWVTVLSVLALFGVFLLVKNQYQNQKEPCRNFVSEPQVLPADISRNEVLVVIADFFQVDGIDVADDPDGNLFVQLNTLADQINAEGTLYPVRVQQITSPAVHNERDAKTVSDCLDASITIFGEVSKGSIRYVTYTKSRALDHSEYSEYDSVTHLTDEKLSEYVLSGGNGPYVLNAIIGQFYEADKQYIRAEQYFTQAIQWAQNNPPVSDKSLSGVYSSRGLVYSQMSHFDLALADANQYVLLDPNNALAYAVRGMAYMQLTQYDNAIYDFDVAINMLPEIGEFHVLKGLAYFYKREFNLAIASYDKAIEINKAMNREEPIAYHARGKLYELMGYTDLAKSDLNKARELGYIEAP